MSNIEYLAVILVMIASIIMFYRNNGFIKASKAILKTMLGVALFSTVMLIFATYPMVMILSIVAFLYFLGKAEEKRFN